MIWLRPASLMVSVGDIKYLKARSRLSLSKHSVLSSGSFTVLHIRSAMLRAALCRSSWSDSLHKYLWEGDGSSDRAHMEHYGMLLQLFLCFGIIGFFIMCFVPVAHSVIKIVILY